MGHSSLAEAMLGYVSGLVGLPADAALLVGISGGCDSVALTHLLVEAGYRPGLVHVNFGLRGAESLADAEFVRQLGRTLDLPVYVSERSAKAYAEQHNVSTQVAARQLRYDFFEEVLDQTGARWLCTAHHRGDVVESGLYSLVRSKDFAILQGIPPVRDRYLRPVLFATKADLKQYLEARNLSWREDASNLSTDYPRNFLRHEVLPRLSQLNPALEAQLAERMQLYTLQYRYLTQVIDARSEVYWVARGPGAAIDIDRLLSHEGPAFAALFLYHALETRLGFSHADVRRTRELLHSQTGRYLEAQGWRITRDRGRLLIDPLTGAPDTDGHLGRLLLQPGENRWGPWQIRLTLTDDPALIDTLQPPPPPGVVWMDADGLDGQLCIRLWEPGDRMRPIHFDGEKKISDILTERKLSGAERERSFVIVTTDAGTDRVLYLEGYRIDERVALTDATRRVAELRFFLHER